MLAEELKKIVKGDVLSGAEELDSYSRDASIFEIKPGMIIKPKDAEDIKKIVKFVAQQKSSQPSLSLTARAAGTDMTGGPLNDSVILDFTAHLNKMMELGDSWAVVEPGMYYRDFEKLTLASKLFLPSYPASREICAVGGMVANNAGGEKSLKYGKTDRYVQELSAVLSDGEEYTVRKLNRDELEEKKSQNGFEGEVYRKMHELLESHYDQIQAARPLVSKNSAGYALWDVWDKKNFDLSKLLVGSQGTLGLITKIKFKLVKPAISSSLLVIFLRDVKILGEVIRTVADKNPESFELFDDHTLKLALRFMPEIIRKMKGRGLVLALKFLPEFFFILTSGLPRLVLMAEFAGDDKKTIMEKIKNLKDELKRNFKIEARLADNEADAQKYWTIRRESFNLLRKRVRGKRAAPFIDDIIVDPDKLTEFLPLLQEVFGQYKELTYTIAGHAGDGNFHIIPLMDLTKESNRRMVFELAEKVYDLVIKFGGSITAEHNDGLMRTPYLSRMFKPEIQQLFEKTKKIFDPQNIFNPGKKVGGDLNYAINHMRHD